MARRRLAPGLAALAALALALPAPAGEVCDPGAGNGPVSLMVLATPKKVHELARALSRGVPVVARDATTVVFLDGRVITSDVEAVNGHLNRLGWTSRRIDFVATFAKPRARATRRRG